MSLALLDGTTAAFDFTIQIASSGSAISAKCFLRYVSIDFAREMFDVTTFCTGGWRIRRPGMKAMTGSASGFASSGSALSDPLALMGSNVASAMVATFDTGCTITCSIHETSDHTGMTAAAMGERSIGFENAGTPTTAWVVA